MWDIDLNIIYDATNAIRAYKHLSKATLYYLCGNISDVLRIWTGNTWVGIAKHRK